jgi:two-component system, chemotaxis family, protein-glutamate methylesterase/glutaminase
MAGQIRVLVVDDSALIRSLLQEIVNDAPDMHAVGAASDPHAARDLIKRLDPDVVTLDVEMPRMNGLDFLEKLMRLRPTRVLMVSTVTRAGSEVTMRALQLGAIDFVAKPQLGIEAGMIALAEELQRKIRSTYSAKLRGRAAGAGPIAVHEYRASTFESSERVFAIGASTGGTEAIAQILRTLPANAPAMLITQHMPPVFTASFAQRLDRECRIRVVEAKNGERILPGHAYVAPGDKHLEVRRAGSNYVTRLTDDPPVNRHRPSVDVLFNSVAKAAGSSAIGAILTGMGTDGASGLAAMRKAGAHTIAQDEESSLIFGMPKAAIELGGAVQVLGLDLIAGAMLGAAESGALRYRT